MTAFDRAAALVAAGYFGPDKAATTYRRIQRGDSAADLDLIGTLSDSTLGRIGALDLSPAVLAIWSEQCRAFADTKASLRAPRVTGFFARYYSPCPCIQASPKESALLTAKHVCLAVTPADPRVPPVLSLAAFSGQASTAVRRFTGGHAELDGLAKCLGTAIKRH